MLVRIAGLGPGDPSLLTIGSLDALRAIGAPSTPLAPPDLRGYLARNGVEIVRGLIDDPALFVRGGSDEIERFVERVQTTASRATRDWACSGIRSPTFPGLPQLLRALERAGIADGDRAGHAARDAVGRDRHAARSAAAAIVAALVGRLRRNHGAAAHGLPVGPRADAPHARSVSHRRNVRGRRSHRERRFRRAVRRARRLAAADRLPLAGRDRDRKVRRRRRRQRAFEQNGAAPSARLRRRRHRRRRRTVAQLGDDSKRSKKPAAARKSRLDGIPKHLGALQRGQRMQEKASRVGFDWPDVDGILDKLDRGDCANSPRPAANKQDDAARARRARRRLLHAGEPFARARHRRRRRPMRQANEKFYRRFSFMEERAAAGGKTLSDLSLDELEELWQLAKTHGVATDPAAHERARRALRRQSRRRRAHARALRRRRDRTADPDGRRRGPLRRLRLRRVLSRRSTPATTSKPRAGSSTSATRRAAWSSRRARSSRRAPRSNDSAGRRARSAGRRLPRERHVRHAKNEEKKEAFLVRARLRRQRR